MRAPSARATKALLIVAAVSSIMGLEMSSTSLGFPLKKLAAASAETKCVIRWSIINFDN